MPKNKKPKYVKSADSKKYQKYLDKKDLADQSAERIAKYKEFMATAGGMKKDESTGEMVPFAPEGYHEGGVPVEESSLQMTENEFLQWENEERQKEGSRIDELIEREKKGKGSFYNMGLRDPNYFRRTRDNLSEVKAPKREVVVGEKPKKEKRIKGKTGNSITFNSRGYQKRTR